MSVTEPEPVQRTYGEAGWEWRKVRARAVPVDPTSPRRRRRGFMRLPMADRSRKVTLRVVYRGGAEAWWLIEARGEHEIFHGALALEDVMARVLSER